MTVLKAVPRERLGHWSSGWSQLGGSAQMKGVVLVIGMGHTDKETLC